MSTITVYDLSWMIPSVIMIVLWLIMLVHICRGNRNKWLFINVVMLLLGAVGSVLTGWTLYELTVRNVSKPAICYLFGVAVFLAYGMFSISHYLLAVRYRKMVRNVPLLLEGKPAKPETTRDRIVYWLLFFLNITAPFVVGCSLIAFRLQVNIKGLPPDKWISICSNTALMIVGLV